MGKQLNIFWVVICCVMVGCATSSTTTVNGVGLHDLSIAAEKSRSSLNEPFQCVQLKITLINHGESRYFYNPAFFPTIKVPGCVLVVDAKGQRILQSEYGTSIRGPSSNNWVWIAHGNEYVAHMPVTVPSDFVHPLTIQMVAQELLVYPKPATDEDFKRFEKAYWEDRATRRVWSVSNALEVP